MKPVTAILIGAGERGMRAYAPFALRNPNTLKFVAVAEPDAAKREEFARQHGLEPAQCFESYELLLALPKQADCALVCTQDQMHVQPTLQALRGGYHVLLEKPMATTEAGCREMVEAAKAQGRYLMVCHVLRYAPYFTALKKLLDDGVIGRLMTVQHVENIAYWHFAHSFVRGNWSVQEKSAPMILAKCCHDLDLLHWLVGGRCLSLNSYGALSHFTGENAPQGAPARCTDGCAHANHCLYFAPRQYLGAKTEWPVSAISLDASLEARTEALHTGPYGRCVYRCDNDVCDHQTVNLQFDNEVTATLTATAFSTDINRHTVLTGTKGEITGDFENATLLVKQHGSGRVDEIRLNVGLDGLGHGGGDQIMMQDFVDLVRDGKGEAKTLAEDSLASHLMAFAAETSRLEGREIVLK